MLRDCDRFIHMRATLTMSAGAETGRGDSKRSNDRIEHPAASVGATIRFGVFALLLAVSLPGLLESFSSSGDPLDASWAWIMGYAFQHHLQWGKAVLFTYDPLGFLANPSVYSDHILWHVPATVRLASWFGFALTLGYTLCRLAENDKSSPRATIAVTVAQFLGPSCLRERQGAGQYTSVRSETATLFGRGAGAGDQAWMSGYAHGGLSERPLLGQCAARSGRHSTGNR